MTDLNPLVAAIAKAAPIAPVRLRLGAIVSVAADSTATVTIGGGTTQVSGVKVASSCCPVPGAACWIATDGRDMFVLATLAPAGPAYGATRQNAAQSVPNNTWTDLDFTSRTDTASVGVTLTNSGMTFVVPGLYMVTASVDFVANSTGQRHARLMVNGTTVWHGNGHDAAAGSDVTRLHADGIIKAAAGDTLTVNALQTSGGALNTQIGVGYCQLRVVWVGPTV